MFQITDAEITKSANFDTKIKLPREKSVKTRLIHQLN